MKLIANIDGGSRGNPGPAAVGVVVKRASDNLAIHEAGYFLGEATNNVAEYHGLLRALDLAVTIAAEELEIRSDSELMVRQISGHYRVRSADLLPLFERAQAMLLKINTWRIKHVRREENTRADALVNMALDSRRDVLLKDATAGATAAAAPAAPRRHTPRWVVQFEETPGPVACPADMKANHDYPFGPGTPAGFCVYAALAVCEDGPLAPGGGDGSTQCPRCGTAMTIKKV